MIQATKYLLLISVILFIVGGAQMVLGTLYDESVLGGVGAIIFLVGFGTYLGFSTSWICENDKKK